MPLPLATSDGRQMLALTGSSIRSHGSHGSVGSGSEESKISHMVLVRTPRGRLPDVDLEEPGTPGTSGAAQDHIGPSLQ